MYQRKIICIYTIRFDGCNRVYVGGTVDFKNRVRCHKAFLNTNRGAKRLQNAYNKHGKHAMRFEILELCTPETLTAREQHWIDALDAFGQDTGLNGRPIADRPLNFKHSDESILKMRNAATGRKLSIEQRLHLKEVTSFHNPEVRAKIAAAKRGKSLSAEHKNKISISTKGVKKTKAHADKLRSKLQALCEVRTKKFTYNGMTMSASDWAKLLGVETCTINWRLRHWPIEKALSAKGRGYVRHA